MSSTPPSLDDLFRRTLARRADALALIDPPDKARITGTAPRRLTYAQADAAISAIARHFNQAMLPKGSVVALQLPNTVEAALTLLGIMRSGLVAAPLPQLWRHADLTAALTGISARGLVTFASIDGTDHAALALRAAAETMSIRHVCGFGALPNEIVRIDETAGLSTLPQEEIAARDAAVVTFDITADGLAPVTRNHLQAIAGGLAVYLECGMGQDVMLSTLPPSSFAGASATLTSWLLSGGTLALHHAFDPALLKRQLRDENCDALVVPGPLASRLADAGLYDDARALRRVIGLWRMPEQVMSSAEWLSETASLTDVYAFGETGLFSAKRLTKSPANILPGPYGAPRGRSGAATVGETQITFRGTLALRGPMTVPASAEKGEDWIDTGFSARRDRKSGGLVITAPPPGIHAVGGYRFRSGDLNDWAGALGDEVMLTALPDRMSGYRLAGRATNNAAARKTATDQGLNALVSDAFRERGAKVLLGGD